ncbi:MAG: TonB-dependent receptor [Caulobacter sp.]|nr:TonB-dependent receptor [Caulobacter sp.]
MALSLNRGVKPMDIRSTIEGRLKIRLLAASASVFALAAATGVHAQEAPAPAPEPQTTGVEEVVVTAQRREEKLQDVPIAITAFGDHFLAERNIVSFDSIAAFTPNIKIVVTNRNSAPSIAMRGSVTVNPAPSYDPTTGLYIDGVYQGKQYGSLVDLGDIERIEVLRGPQGTLYGRNTLAGAVNIVTHKPTGEFGGSLKAGVSEYNGRMVRGLVDLPAYGNLSISLAGGYDQHDGYVKVRPDPFNNIPTQAGEYGAAKNYAGRLSLRYRFTDSLMADYTFDYAQSNDTLGYSQPTFVVPGSALASTFGKYIFSNNRSDFGYEGGALQNSITGGHPLAEDTRNRQHALTFTWALPNVTLKSITSYRSLNHDTWNDVDGTPLNLIASGVEISYKSYSQEFQGTGELGPLKYTAGLYFFHDSGYTNNPQQYFGGNFSMGGYGFRTTAYAAYGQVEYTPSFAPEFTVVAGLRYNSEKKGTDRNWRTVSSTTGALISTQVPFGTTASKTFTGFTPTVTLKFQATDNVNFYGRYARGFKSGGFNGEATNPVAATLPYNPETVDSYEVGMKSRFYDGRLQVNVAAFYDKHSDMQLSVFLGAGNLASVVANAGSAEISGLEAEVQLRPADWLRLSASFGTLDARYLEYIDGGVNVANQRAFPYAPKMTSSINADARLLRIGDSEVHLLVDYSHSDPYYLFPYGFAPGDQSQVGAATPNTVVTTQADTSDIVDLRLKWSFGPFEASVWGKNVFDVSNRVSGIDFGPSFSHATVSFYNPPRVIGADLSYKF